MKPIFLMFTAMWLCLSAPNLFAQTETPELREIFKDTTLSRLLLEEVGFYPQKQIQKPTKAWRVACQYPEYVYKGLWRKDSLEVAEDVVWLNSNFVSFTSWAEDTVLFSDKQPIQKPLFHDLPETFIKDRMSQWEMDSLEFEINYRQVKEPLQYFKDLRSYKNQTIFLVEEGEVQGESFKYCVVKSDDENITYHFYNEYEDDFSWVNCFIVDFKNLRVWNGAPQKAPNFKKIFK